ncbi:hypothetical protein [Pseudoalteromonas sp. S558]|uniref:hypothetical protein n=1 Tax=Pseudoalteromonas sp. S558 TaxID=2066515 RepID=UPI00110A2B86|nr:hypothetical protein [Pseudoalteromonas sp. S558]TMO09467.1 hypothetical protein CWB66_01890 [Pseudoalteromonas sp. S558]
MSDNKINDEVTDKVIKAVKQVMEAKNNGELHPLEIDDVLATARIKAEELYKRTKNPEALLIMGLTDAEIDKIKRKRGQPEKTLYDPRHIVQLVYKQSLQAGVPFTNKAGKEMNECFIAVAEHQGVGVDQIVRQYKKVPMEEREKIKEWLKRTLKKHNKLNNR